MAQQIAEVPRVARTRSASFTRTRTISAWLFLVPTLLVVAIVAVYPLIQTFYLSLTSTRLNDTKPTEFVWFQNYINLFSDDNFKNSVITTIFFTLLTVVFEFILGLAIALVVNSNFKGRGAMRAAMLIPWAIPTVVSTQIWRWMYNDVYGVFNDILVNKLHLLGSNVAFIAGNDTPSSLLVIAAVDIWKTAPFVALLLLAGMQLIPLDIYEAARVDGASKVQQFFTLTLPLLRPAILVALIFRTLDALRVFDVFYVLFKGKPNLQTMSTYAQDNLVNFSKIGYGSAICVVIFFIIAIFVAIYLMIFKTDEEVA